jgi:hypothetical protein
MNRSMFAALAVLCRSLAMGAATPVAQAHHYRFAPDQDGGDDS